MGAVPAAAADGQASPERAPLIVAQSQSVDDQTIEAVAAAQVQIRQIQLEWQSVTQNTQNADELEQARQHANSKMVDAIQAQGLSIEEYNTFMAAANQNPSLLERLQDAMSDYSG